MIAVLAAVVSLSGCLRPDTRSDPEIGPADSRYTSTVQVRFLGVAGFFVRLGHDVILTAPLYSNPDLLSEASAPIRPSEDRIRRFHFAHLDRGDDVRDVRAILVGHAHYDHLMDVPYVWRFSPQAKILGTMTMVNVLAPYTRPCGPDGECEDGIPRIPRGRLVALNRPDQDFVDSRNCSGQDPSPQVSPAAACTPFSGAAGRPYPLSKTLSIRAFCGRHPDQLPPLHQAPGCLAQPLSSLPISATEDYLEGESLTYLIDFLEPTTQEIRFRVYFQDVPTDGSFGKVPADVLAQHRVDLAMLCAGNWSAVHFKDADSIIRNLAPEHVLIGHWEDFFKAQDQKPLTPAPLQRVGEYRRRLRKRMEELGGSAARRRVVLPAPQVLRTFPIH